MSPTVLVAAVLSAPVIRDTMYAIPGLIMSATSESTMLLNAPPTTTPTAISTTFPRDIKSLNSSTNFIAIYPTNNIIKILIFLPRTFQVRQS